MRTTDEIKRLFEALPRVERLRSVLIAGEPSHSPKHHALHWSDRYGLIDGTQGYYALSAEGDSPSLQLSLHLPADFAALWGDLPEGYAWAEAGHSIARRETIDCFAAGALEMLAAALLDMDSQLGQRLRRLMSAPSERLFPLNQILYGTPGTGKTYEAITRAVAIIENLPLRTLEEVERIEILRRFEQYRQSGQIGFVCFHASLSYEDFIEGIKPQTNAAGTLSYSVQAGIFRELCAQAAAQSAQNFVLIIDEINRGNVAQIFGELITLLEDSKRLGCAEALRLQLPYSRQLFGVPANLYLLGTMNSADRSTTALDSALRRRFQFVEMPPRVDLLQGKQVAGIDLGRLLGRLNERIAYFLGADYLLGHAYLLGIDSLPALTEVWEQKILPLLQEYFFGDGEKLRLILGEGFVRRIQSEPLLAVDDGDWWQSKPQYQFLPITDLKAALMKGRLI